MAAKNWKQALNLGHHSTNLVFNNFAYILFLGFLAIVYIANAHYAEKKVREIQHTQKEIKELRWQYMSVKSELMRQSTQSQLKEVVDNDGLVSNGNSVKVVDLDR